MFIKKSLFPLFAIFIGLPLIIGAQAITLDELLELARVKHPLFEKEELATGIASQSRNAQLGGKDWRLSLGPSYTHQTTLAMGTFSPERLNLISAGASLEKAIWNTGGRLSLSWSSDMIDQKFFLKDIILEPPTVPETMVISAGPQTFYQNTIYLTYTQPLFQNFRGILDRLGYEIGQYSVDIASVQALEKQEEFLLDMGMRFIDWALLTEQKTIANERLRLTGEQLEQARRKRAANLVDDVDVLRSEDAVRIAEQIVVLMEAQWKAKQAELAVLTRSDELYSLAPAFDLYKRQEPPQFQAAADRLHRQSRLLQALAIRRKQLETLHRGSKETTKPQLYLRTQLAVKSGDIELGSSLGFDKNDAGVFLQFSYPLGNRSAIAETERSKLQIRHHDLEVNEIELGLEASLRNLLIQMEGMEKVLALNEQQIKSAQRKTQEELKRYNQGRGDLAFVIQSQDNEERARLTYAQNAATYQGLNLQFKALTDKLLTATAAETD